MVNGEILGTVVCERPVRAHGLCVPTQLVSDGEHLGYGELALPIAPVTGLGLGDL